QDVAAQRQQRLHQLLARAQRAAGAHRVLEPDAGALVVALALVELTELATGHGLGEAVASRRSELERAAEASVGGLVVPGERLDIAQSQQDRDGLLLRDDVEEPPQVPGRRLVRVVRLR